MRPQRPWWTNRRHIRTSGSSWTLWSNRVIEPIAYIINYTHATVMSAYQRRWVTHIRLKIWPAQWFACLPWALPCTQHNIGPPALAESLGEVSGWSYTGRSPSIEHFYSRGASGNGTQLAWGDLHLNMTYLKETSAWKRFTLKTNLTKNEPYL